ncbi:hypothetical protein [Salipaludibacillus aurantiacus]|uniref:Uncharacterized protein n=1 Tax=Salipaludibacillus aurantiacus TaxID=1601833 RepID=A0A1H9P5N9_9BACI|nr:hypothetical protein [Salipaludibacillus aurantiacus]SER42883.1 hypothetical protein SAMN05518684_101135 [Salipaludibacillus aurantiacus]
MQLQMIRRKLEEVAHLSQELKNSYMRLDENEQNEFKVGYPLDVDVDEFARHMYEWSQTQLNKNE